MPEHRWSVLCRRAIVDRFTNVMSILEIMDEVNIEKERDQPDETKASDAVIAIEGQLVSVWYRERPDRGERFWETITVTTPDGEIHPTQGRQQGNLEDYRRLRLIAGVKSIPFRGPGVYLFNIHCAKSEQSKGKVVATVPLEVKVLEPASPSSTAPAPPPGQS